MTERSVMVKVGANMSGLVSEFEKGRRKAQEFSKTVTGELARNEQDFQRLGTAAGAMAAAGALALGGMISKSADFDQAMSYVEAATHETTGNMERLRDAALEAGSSTVFSATESANAVEELSKASLSTADILDGALTGSLDLAAAGGLGVARAAEIASTTLQQFQLDGSKAGHVADVLAAGAGKAMGSVEDLSNGLKFVGPVAQSLGVSLEETTGTLALFAQQGIIGEQAGTSLRGVLASLTSPSKEARGEIERLGLQLFDAQGKFLGLENAAGQLNNAYGEMDDQSRLASMGIIFGRETITAATALYQAGAEGVREWTAAVDDAGYAQETARLRLDNLKGDIEAFSGAAETAFIKTGSAGDDATRNIVQAGTSVVDFYNGLPDQVQSGTLALIAGATAAAGLTAAFTLGVPKLVEYRTSMEKLAKDAPKTTAALRGMQRGFIGLTAIAASLPLLDAANEAINGLGISAEDLSNRLKTSDISTSIDAAFGDLDGQFNREDGPFQRSQRALDDFGKTLRSVGETTDTRWASVFGDVFTGEFGSGVNEARNRLESFGGALATLPIEDAQARMQQLRTEYGLDREELEILVANSGDFRNSLIEQATQLGLTSEPATLLALALGEIEGASTLATEATEAQEDGLARLGGAAAGSSEEVQSLADAIRGFAEYVYASRDAARQYEASIDDLTQSVVDNGTSLDITTEAGRSNQSALDALATATLANSSAIQQQTGSQEEARAALQRGREELIRQLEQFGITGQAAEDYADDLGLIPGNIRTVAELDTSGASAAADSFISKYTGRTISLRFDGTPVIDGVPQVGRADGGPIYGPGGPRDDRILARLSNGEHVLTAREVEAAGGHAGVYSLRRQLLSGDLLSRAGGGPIYRQSVQYASSSAPRVVVQQSGGGGGSGIHIGSVTAADPRALRQELELMQMQERLASTTRVQEVSPF